MRILTGDRPSGHLHLGHYVGSLKNRLVLQDSSDAQQYILIADLQALTDDPGRAKILKENVHQVMCDYLAIGLDPLKSTFFVQSMIHEIAEITMIFLNMVSVNRLMRNPTVKIESVQKNFGDSMPAGFLVYPVSQAADILTFLPTHVPVGEDQIPMIEQTNELARAFNRIYDTHFFPDVAAMVPKTGRLMGIDGKAKMSKTLNNAVYLSDNADVVASKVTMMYTDPLHLRVEDPGNIDGNVVFTYLDIFDPNKDEVAELKAHYQRGGLGDMKLKRRLIDVLNTFLEPIRTRRKLYENDREATKKLLFEGTQRAKIVAQETMRRVREIMGIDYL